MTITKPILKFASNVSTGKHTINLVTFFKKRDSSFLDTVIHRFCFWRSPSMNLWDEFLDLIEEMTQDSPLAVIDERFTSYMSREKVTDAQAKEVLEQRTIDLTTDTGRAEARRRMGVAAYYINKQRFGHLGPKGVLTCESYAERDNVIGWFKTKHGEILCADVSWDSETDQWTCRVTSDAGCKREEKTYFWMFYR